ncbi:MAG: hypothetical protein V5804_11830 [Mucilaginibacter sp.]|uniref:hypothetical protein n=1 Tax=Mucilaginibacter sp. TaxID=1882438 RepID=UPI0034E4DF0D
MKATELRSAIHRIVKATENEQVLQACYDFLKLKQNEKDDSIWKSLNEEQQDEILLAYEESNQSKNLIDAKTVFKGFK